MIFNDVFQALLDFLYFFLYLSIYFHWYLPNPHPPLKYLMVHCLFRSFCLSFGDGLSDDLSVITIMTLILQCLTIFYYQEKRAKEKAEKATARAEAKAKAKSESQTKRDSISSSTSIDGVESVEVLYHQGVAGTGQPNVNYPRLGFKPFAMFALGSPIGMFMTVR